MLEGKSPIPQIDLREVPEEEQDNIRLLNGQLKDMSQYVTQFGAAAQLFDYCTMQTVAIGHMSDAFKAWIFISCRDAVMSLYHFRQEMLAANNLANKSKYVFPNLNRAALNIAHSKFEKYFPDHIASRHAVAHEGELAKDMKSFNANAFSGSIDEKGIKAENVRGMMMQGNLRGRTYFSTIDGKIVAVEVSGETVQLMHDVAVAFYDAFREPPKEAEPQPAS